MQVEVRFGAGVANLSGNSALTITLPAGATVADLVQHLRENNPLLAQRLASAFPFVDGRAVTPAETLREGAQVIFVSALAGG